MSSTVHCIIHTGTVCIYLQKVPEFGPLFSGSIIDARLLGPLVRATAINASLAVRLVRPDIQPLYVFLMKLCDIYCICFECDRVI